MNENTKKTKKTMMVKVKVTQEVELGGIISQAIEEYGAGPILKQISYVCLMNSAIATSPISSMLKSKREVDRLIENTEYGQALMYVVNHWDEMKKLGKEYYQEISKKHE